VNNLVKSQVEISRQILLKVADHKVRPPETTAWQHAITSLT